MKMNRMLKATIAALGICSIAPVSWSSEVAARGPLSFTTYDRDSDGKISPEEFIEIQSARRAARQSAGMPVRRNMPGFADFDVNSDGFISREELAAGQQRMRNRQGRVRGGGNRATFADFDLDGNGVIVEEEFLRARGQRMSKRAQAGYPMRHIANPATFEELDLNHDGMVSPDEFYRHQQQYRRR